MFVYWSTRYQLVKLRPWPKGETKGKRFYKKRVHFGSGLGQEGHKCTNLLSVAYGRLEIVEEGSQV